MAEEKVIEATAIVEELVAALEGLLALVEFTEVRHGAPCDVARAALAKVRSLPGKTKVICMNSCLELMPCLKCGSRHVYVTCADPGDGLGPYWAQCDDCGIRTIPVMCDEDAAADWNKRVLPFCAKEKQ